MKKRKSIICQDQYMGYCTICGKPTEAVHHCLGGSKRQIADREGMVIGLCNDCHNMSDNSVHFNRKLTVMCHLLAQEAWMKKYIIEKCGLDYDETEQEAIEAFRKMAGESFL